MIVSRLKSPLALLALGLSLAAQAPETILKDAIGKHQSGDFNAAIGLYRQYLKLRPESPDALSNLGAALAHEGQFAAAIEEYTHALRLNPDNTAARFNLGLAYYKSGDSMLARQQFEAAAKAMGANRQVSFLTANCDIRLGEYKAAIAMLDPWEKENPDDPGLDYLLGTALIRDNQAERGAALIDRILRRGESPEAHLLLGTAKLMARDIPAALPDLRKAIELNPKLPEAHAYLGQAYATVGDFEHATPAFEQELALDPHNFMALFQLGLIAVRDFHPDRARGFFSRSLEVHPGDLATRYQIALLDVGAERFEDARKSLEKLIADSPKFVEGHVTLATIYYRLKRKEDGDREREIVRQLTAENQAKEPGAKPE
jgi:tetratricopeptide (TPR) repeat protein